MLTIELPAELEARLEALAQELGLRKEDCVREAILQLLEDREDAAIAAERIRRPAKRWSLDDLEQGRDLER